MRKEGGNGARCVHVRECIWGPAAAAADLLVVGFHTCEKRGKRKEGKEEELRDLKRKRVIHHFKRELKEIFQRRRRFSGYH